MPLKILTVAHSPDPDDAFMFYGLSRGYANVDGYRVRHVLKDIQSLNQDAKKGKYHVTAVSAAAYPSIASKYWVLSVGASVGRKYGPVIVCRPGDIRRFSTQDWSRLKIAIPGFQTTAYLLLRLFRRQFKAVDMPFDRIIAAVKKGQVDGGLVIHEGQITHRKEGLVKVLDLGKWWHKETGLPIPLGLDVVRKDLGRTTASTLAKALVESIRWAYRNKTEAVRYALKYGRGIDAKVGERFVKMYVNRDTLDLGREGTKALKLLFRRAYREKLLKRKITLEIVRP